MEDIFDENQSVELVVFNVDGLRCGIKTEYVKEINKHIELTKIYSADKDIRGVINLRGQIVTVLDLRKKFDRKSIELNEDVRIVIVNLDVESIGLLVDKIEDIIIAGQKDIESPPANINGIAGSFFYGIYKGEDALVSILNIEEILKSTEVSPAFAI